MIKITRRKTSQMRRYRLPVAGFTLIELMIVIALVGILSAVAFPAISKWVPSYQLKAAAQELYANLQKAKLHAVKTNRIVIFNFTFLAGCSGPTGYTFTENSTGVVVVNETMQNGVCISASSFDNTAPLTSGFNPRGLAAGQLGSVTLQDATATTSRVYTISQSLAGSIRIQ